MQSWPRILERRSALLCKENCKVRGLFAERARSAFQYLLSTRKIFQSHSTSPDSLMTSVKGNDKILLCFYFSRLDGSLSSLFACQQANCWFNSLANVEANINVLLFRNSLFIIVINMISIFQEKFSFFIRILHRKLTMISHGCWKKVPLLSFIIIMNCHHWQEAVQNEV